MTNVGKIKKIIGPVVDVYFEEKLPSLYNALEVKNGKETLVLEVQQHAGGNVVRAIAMGSTDGLKRGLAVNDTGRPIAVPVGPKTLGRIFNLLGQPLDDKEPVVTEETWPIHS